MKIYKHSGVNYQTDIFSDIKSFDVVGIDELLMLHEKLVKIYTQKSDMGQSVTMPGSIHGDPHHFNKMVKNRGEYLYLELPYKFFKDNLIGWTHDICLIDSDIDIEKQDFCDCYKCVNKKHHILWKSAKQKILDGIEWGGLGKGPGSYGTFKTFKQYGIAKPIYNYSNDWPKFGTHRIAYSSVLKSDIPFFFRIFPDNSENVYLGYYPYFKDKKYCHMKIMKNEKKVSFYLSSYWSNFDEDRDEKIGEIIYK